MKHEKLIDDVLIKTGHALSVSERMAINVLLMAGEQFGFGNMISWLSTAWAGRLREQEVDAKTAIAGEWGHAYPLPPRKKPDSPMPDHPPANEPKENQPHITPLWADIPPVLPEPTPPPGCGQETATPRTKAAILSAPPGTLLADLPPVVASIDMEKLERELTAKDAALVDKDREIAGMKNAITELNYQLRERDSIRHQRDVF